MSRAPTRRAGLGKRLGFAAFTVLLAFGLLEGVARLGFQADLEAREAPPPAPADGAPTMKGNPYLLWEQAPGTRIEHGVKAYINSLGMRSPEPTEKPRGTRRLLVTGDSSVYGFGVDDGEPFINVAADLLGDDVEGWNAAIPGYSSYQSINFLEMRVWDAVQPDVLVIANLWSDNNFDEFIDKELLSAYSSFEDGGLRSLHRVLEPMALYRVLHYRLTVDGTDQAAARKVGWSLGSGQQIGQRRVEVHDYAANLEYMTQMALDDGAEVVFVQLANREDMKGPRTNPAAWTLYREVMADVAEKYGAPVVEVPPIFYSSKKPSYELFIDEMHPTRAGHRMIGEALAEALAEWGAGGSSMGPRVDKEIGPYRDTFVFHGGENGQGTDAQPPQPGDPQATAGTAKVNVQVKLTGFDEVDGLALQLDVLGERDMRIGGTNFEVGPGYKADTIAILATDSIHFRLYDDKTGNGPSQDDRAYDFGSVPGTEDIKVELDRDSRPTVKVIE